MRRLWLCPPPKKKNLGSSLWLWWPLSLIKWYKLILSKLIPVCLAPSGRTMSRSERAAPRPAARGRRVNLSQVWCSCVWRSRSAEAPVNRLSSGNRRRAPRFRRPERIRHSYCCFLYHRASNWDSRSLASLKL